MVIVADWVLPLMLFVGAEETVGVGVSVGVAEGAEETVGVGVFVGVGAPGVDVGVSLGLGLGVTLPVGIAGLICVPAA